MTFFWFLVVILIVLPLGFVAYVLYAVLSPRVAQGDRNLRAAADRAARAQLRRDSETLGE